MLDLSPRTTTLLNSHDIGVLRVSGLRYQLHRVLWSTCLGVFLVFLLSALFSMRLVAGWSMIPAVAPGDIIVTQRLCLLCPHSPLRRGDLVVLIPPSDSSYTLKRVVGLPREHIALVGTSLLINDTFLDEPYISSLNTKAEVQRVTLHSDEYFVLGDNRSASTDSRHYGAVQSLDLREKVLFVVRVSRMRLLLSV